MQGRKNNVRLGLGRRKAADTHKQGETSLKGCGHSANQGTNQTGGSSASYPQAAAPTSHRFQHPVKVLCTAAIITARRLSVSNGNALVCNESHSCSQSCQ